MRAIPLIHEDDCPVILGMSDHPAYCLVHSPASLQFVPGVTIYLTLSKGILPIKIVLLGDNLRIHYLGVRYASHDHTSSCIIHEVYPFTKLPSANSYEDSFTLSLDLLLVSYKLLIVLVLILMLNEDLLTFFRKLLE